MSASARIETNALDDSHGVETLDLGIGVELIEVRDTQCQISIGKELHCLCFLHAHEESVNIWLECAFLQESGEGACKLLGIRVADGCDGCILLCEVSIVDLDELWEAHDDA